MLLTIKYHNFSMRINPTFNYRYGLWVFSNEGYFPKTDKCGHEDTVCGIAIVCCYTFL